MRVIIIPVFLVSLLSGCLATAPNIADVTADYVASQNSISSSEFDSSIKVTGVEVRELKNRGLMTETQTYFLRSWLDKGEDTGERHQLYFNVHYTGDWRFYSGANKSGGDYVSTTEIDRDVISCKYNYLGCDHSETVGVSLTREDIENAAGNGLSIRFNTRYSDLFNVVEIPANYFQGYLITLDSAKPGSI